MMSEIVGENQTELSYKKQLGFKEVVTVFSTILFALFSYRYTLDAVLNIPYSQFILSNYILLLLFITTIIIHIYSDINTTMNSINIVIVGVLLFVFYGISIVWSPMIGYSFQKLLYATFQMPVLLLFVFFVVSRSRLYIWIFILATLFGSYLLGLDLLLMILFSGGMEQIITDGIYIGVNRLLGIGVVISVFVIRHTESTISQLLNIFFSLLNVFLMTQTGGRGPLIATCVAIIFFGIWNIDKIFTVRNFLGYILVIAVSLPALLLSRGRTIDRLLLLISNPGESATTRIEMAIHSIGLFSEQPIFGYGIGSFPTLYRSGGYQYPHNIFLEFLVESGILGLLIFIVFICLSLRTVYRYKENAQIFTGMLLSSTIYSLLNASVSFDIFENNTVFIYLIMSTTIHTYVRVNKK